MSQKVAYVTGGMGGIGTAICQRLHKEGYKVIAGCGPTRDFVKWLDEQQALGYSFYASVGNVGGNENAAVLPVPVWAAPITSWPVSTTGMAWAWMGVMDS
jgi:NAD(P)-dependent dehydrogenase (short-subunit alcohol dehydrogenase family)